MPGYKLFITQDPGAPYANVDDVTIGGHVVGSAWHHILPKGDFRHDGGANLAAGLASLWNTMILKNNDARIAKPVLDAIIRRIGDYGTNLTAVDIEQAKTVAKDLRDGKITHPGSGTPDGWDSFIQVYIWLPGNLFRGPRNRADDPKNGFDTPAQLILPQKDQYNLLYDAYGEITAYLGNPSKTGYAQTAFTKLGKVADTYRTRTEFSAAQWTWDSGKNAPKVKGSK
ncbi:hypothetical protein [Streptomyces sp. NPDC047315]|uniref:hypothetical protein n=1 Tax=Streptomyces sp. NPDC047315 TaxID=3155142 RepID=UPI0033C78C01